MRPFETLAATAAELERRGFDPQLFVNDSGTVLYRTRAGEYIDPLTDGRYYAHGRARNEQPHR